MGVKRFVQRRIGDVALVVAWVVVLFNIIQISRTDGESSTRIALSYAAMLAVGVGATVVWARSRRRSRSPTKV